MKKLYLLLLAGTLFFSCSKNNSSDIPEDVNDSGGKNMSFSIQGIMKNMQSRAAGGAGSVINNPQVLDSLIKNIRILVLEDGTGKCLAYGDFDPIRVSLDSVLYMTVPVKTLDFIILTNVTDPLVMPKTGLVGANRSQILAKLKPHASGVANHFEQAGQIFYYNAENIPVKKNPDFAAKENQVQVSLTRLVSQLETTVKQTEVYATSTSPSPVLNYIKTIDTIMLRNVSPDINMSKTLNNQTPLHDASNSILVNTAFDRTNASQPLNKMLSFPNEELGVLPFVIIAATIDPTNLFNTNPDRTITRRYWALQLTQKSLRENVRLELTVNRLLGEGSLTPPLPSPTSTCEFIIKVMDWDPTSDTESGDGVTP